MLNALNSEDKGLKVRFSLAMIAFETFELIISLSNAIVAREKRTFKPLSSLYLVRLATLTTHTPLIKGVNVHPLN